MTSTRHNPQVQVGGTLLVGEELREYAERRGLCHICAQYQTHKRVGGFFKSKMEPLTVTEPDGTISVYKGYCIQPTCYQSVNQVRQLLGESMTRRLSKSKLQQLQTPNLGGITWSTTEDRSDERECKSSGSSYTPPPFLNAPLHTSARRLQHSPPRLHFGETDIPNGALSSVIPPTPTPRCTYIAKPRESQIPISPQLHQQGQETHQEDTSDRDITPSRRGAGFRSSGRVNADAANTALHLTLGANKGSDSITGIQRLEALAKDANFVDFFVRLETEGNTPDVVYAAFQILQEQLTFHHQARPGGVVLSGGGWVKSIDDKLMEFKSERLVVVEGLRTLLCICRQPYNYRIFIVRKGAPEVILTQMEEHDCDKVVMELSCAIFDSISQNPKDKLNANHPKVVPVVRKMVGTILEATISTTFEAKTLALSTLCNLSKQKSRNDSTGKTLLQTIGQVIKPVGDAFADGCAEILLQDDDAINEELAGSIASFLWKVSCASQEEEEEEHRGSGPNLATEKIASFLWKVSCASREEEEEEHRGSGPNLATEKLVSALIETVHRFDSRLIIGAICGAFANLSLKPGFSAKQTESVLLAVCEAVHRPSSYGEERLALCAVHATCNLLSDPARRDAAMGSYALACRLVLELLGRFSFSTELLELGCSVVGHLSFDTRQNQEAIVTGSEEEFDIVLRSFRNLAADRDNIPPELLETVSHAILAWSGCAAGARQIDLSGTLRSVNVLVQVEADPNILEMLEMIIANCLNGPAMRIAPAYEDIIRGQPQLFPTLMQDIQSDPSAATSLIRALRESGALAHGVLDRPTFEVLVPTMSNFSDSEDVQAEVLFLLFEAIQRGVEQWLVVCRDGLPALTDALCRHGDNRTIAEHGCYVLKFVLRQCDLRQITAVRTKLAGALISIMGGRDGVRAASVSMDVYIECIRHDAYYLQSGIQPTTIRTVVGSMNMHLESADLQWSGCNFLRALSIDQHAKEIVGREGGIVAIMTCMMVHGQSKSVCEVALSAIRRLAMSPSNKLLIRQNGGIDVIIENLRSLMSDSEIVSSLFSALNNIVVESESRSVAEVGVEVILLLGDSMSRFPDDEQVQKNACFLLKSCSFRPWNLRIMYQQQSTLVPLLTRAGEVFPEQCRIIATGVVKRLCAYSS